MIRTVTPHRGPSSAPGPKTARNRILRAWRRLGKPRGQGLRAFARELADEMGEFGLLARGWLERKGAKL